MVLRGRLPEAGGQAAEERLGMAGSHELVLRSTSFGLGAFGGEQVTEARSTPDQFTRTGYLEALGNGLFGLLHGWSWTKQRARGRMARGKFGVPHPGQKRPRGIDFSERKSPSGRITQKGLTCSALY